MRKLIVSYTGLLHAIKAGKLTEADLANALFHFGCARSHAMDFEGKHEGSEQFTNEARAFVWYEEGEVIARAKHTEFVAMIEKAESEGRVLWREPGEQQTYSKLSGFLAQHGFDDVIGGTKPNGYGGSNYDFDYSYHGVMERATQAGLQLEVVWRV